MAAVSGTKRKPHMTWVVRLLLLACSTTVAIQVHVNQAQSQSIEQASMSAIEGKAAAGTETKTQSEVDQDESISSLMQKYTHIDGDGAKEAELSEEDAMYAFSKAKLDGVKIMDLPDAPKEKIAQFNDADAAMLYQVNEDARQTTQEEKPQAQPKLHQSSTPIDDQILQLATQFAEQDAALKSVQKQEDTETQKNAQAALDEVAIVIPDGMQVQSHRADKAEDQKSAGEASETPKEGEEATTENQDQNQKVQLEESTNSAQAALEVIQVKNPFEQKPEVKKEQKPKVVDHIFDTSSEQPQEEKKQEVTQQDILTPVFTEEAPIIQKKPERSAEVERALNNAKAASEMVTVKQVSEAAPSVNQTQAKTLSKNEAPDAIMPKSFAQDNGKSQEKNEIDSSIQQAEQAQGDKEEQPEYKENLEKQITGSGSLWESQMQMEHITGKLTNPKQYRPKEVIEKEKRENLKREKQRIRDELLGVQSPVSEMDTSMYSNYMAAQSSKSKSELQVREEAKKAADDKQARDAEKLAKLKAIQEQNAKMQAQLAQEEANQIRQAELVRIKRKNENDMQSVEDLKALEKLQRSSTMGQVQGMVDSAEADENQRQENEQIKQAQNAINSKMEDNMKSQVVATAASVAS